MRPICGACGRTHFKRGVCEPVERTYPPETAARMLVSREELWAVVDAARLFFARTQGGRVGSKFWESAADGLELEFQRLPEEVWKR